MSNETKGHFYVGELPDGRFVAASNASPYFCVRADSEGELIEKVRNAIGFYKEFKGNTGEVRIKSVSKTVTTLRPQRRVDIREILEAA